MMVSILILRASRIMRLQIWGLPIVIIMVSIPFSGGGDYGL